MQYVMLLNSKVVAIFDLKQFDASGIEVDEHNIVITEGELCGCELYEDEDHRFPEGSIVQRESITARKVLV